MPFEFPAELRKLSYQQTTTKSETIMARLLKVIILIIVAFIVLILATGLLLPKLINPDDYRDDIARFAYEKTGLDVRINGSIQWSVFPWVGLSLEKTTVHGNDSQLLASLDSTDIRVKLLPLLRKKVEMQTFSVQSLSLNLIRDKEGHGNWELPEKQTTNQQNSEAASDTDPTPPLPEQQETASHNLQLDIASINITDLNVTYHDLKTDTRYSIEQASLETGPIKTKQPFDVRLKADIASTQPSVKLTSVLEANITFNLKDKLLQLSEITIDITPFKQSEKITLTGAVTAGMIPSQVTGKVNISTFNPKRFMEQLHMPLPSMRDKTAMEKLSFYTEFSADDQLLQAKALQVQLDDFTLKGKLHIPDLPKKTLVFRLDGNALNVDNYLPPVTQSSANTTQEKEQTTPATGNETDKPQQTAPLFPVDLLNNLNLNGSLNLDQLTAGGLIFNKPTVSINAAGGNNQATVHSGFYQGDINAAGTINVQQASTPKISAKARMQNIDLLSLAKAIPSLNMFEGSVNADIDVTSHGQYTPQLTRNLNGNAQFNIQKGVFTKANFNHLVCQAVASIRKKKLAEKTWEETTQFTHLKGTFLIKNGVATNNDLSAILSSLQLKGDGSVNLVKNTIDYHLGLNVRGDESPDQDPACRINEDYVNIVWPMQCQGDLNDPKCGLDHQRLAKTAMHVLKKEAEKQLKKEIEKKLDGPLKEKLRELFR